MNKVLVSAVVLAGCWSCFTWAQWRQVPAQELIQITLSAVK